MGSKKKPCGVCAEMFTPRTSLGTYCSEECAEIGRNGHNKRHNSCQQIKSIDMSGVVYTVPGDNRECPRQPDPHLGF